MLFLLAGRKMSPMNLVFSVFLFGGISAGLGRGYDGDFGPRG